MNIEWLKAKTGLDCISCVVNSKDAELKGMSGAKLIKLEVKLRDGKELALAIKQVLGNNASTSKQLGLIREAMFYKIFAKDVKA